MNALSQDVPLPGEIVDGKYKVLYVLGRGGMGVVLAANHLVLDQTVALKTLIGSHAADSASVERFLREARALAKMRSAHVARVIDVTKLASGAPCIVMEFLEGEDLAAVIDREERVPYARAIDYVLEACEGISEAHSLGIIHRDLKPSNLFVARTPTGDSIKVLDFGVSKLVHLDDADLALTRTKTVLGSPLYMSPEQLRSARTVDARSDIWSLGAILFELMSGDTPFRAETIAELGALVLTTDAPKLADCVPGVPSAISAAVAKCLARDAGQRFATVAELAAAIAPYGTDAARASLARISRGGTPSAPLRVEPSSGDVGAFDATASDERLVAVAASGKRNDDTPASSTIGAKSRTSTLVIAAAAATLLTLAVVVGWRVALRAEAKPPRNDLVSSSGTSASIASGSAIASAIATAAASVSVPASSSTVATPAATASARPIRPAASVATTKSGARPSATAPIQAPPPPPPSPSKDPWDPR